MIRATKNNLGLTLTCRVFWNKAVCRLDLLILVLEISVAVDLNPNIQDLVTPANVEYISWVLLGEHVLGNRGNYPFICRIQPSIEYDYRRDTGTLALCLVAYKVSQWE